MNFRSSNLSTKRKVLLEDFMLELYLTILDVYLKISTDTP